MTCSPPPRTYPLALEQRLLGARLGLQVPPPRPGAPPRIEWGPFSLDFAIDLLETAEVLAASPSFALETAEASLPSFLISQPIPFFLAPESLASLHISGPWAIG